MPDGESSTAVVWDIVLETESEAEKLFRVAKTLATAMNAMDRDQGNHRRCARHFGFLPQNPLREPEDKVFSGSHETRILSGGAALIRASYFPAKTSRLPMIPVGQRAKPLLNLETLAWLPDERPQA